jgi:predicted transcriptional regulator
MSYMSGADLEGRSRLPNGSRKVLTAVALPLELLAKTRALAIAEDRSVSGILRRALDQYVERHSAQHSEAV